MDIILTPELVAMCKHELKIENDFEPSDKVIANHTLYELWKAYSGRNGLPKLMFYIIMNETYGMPSEVDEAGLLGYALKITSKPYGNEK